MDVSIAGLSKAAVLAGLYNASRPQGMGFAQYDPEPMTTEKAQEIIDAGHTYFDYLAGRVMKVDLSGDSFDPWGYDRDNGEGKAATVVRAITDGDVNGPLIQTTHRQGKVAAAEEVFEHALDRTVTRDESGLPTMRLGLGEVADELLPYVHRGLSS